jgi:hypothetical protein
MTTLTTTWLLAGTISCLIAAVSQRHALRNLAFGIVRFDAVQALIAAMGLAVLFIAGPIGLALVLISPL